MATLTPPAKARTLLAPNDKVAIIAGSGRLPVDVAEALIKAGHPPYVYLVNGEADAAPSLLGCDHETVNLGDFSRLVPRLRARKITHLVLAGGIGRRPKLSEVPVTWWLIRSLPAVLAGLARGDDGLLT